METPDQVVGPAAALRALEVLGVVWPAAELEPLLAQSAALVSAWSCLRPEDRQVHPADHLAAAHYLHSWGEVFDAARTVFAHANHWRVSPTPFSLEQLQCGRRHRQPQDYTAPSWGEVLGVSPGALDFLRGADRRPAALILHAVEDLRCTIAGLRLARLPASWWSPRASSAYVVAWARP